ncbi:MAG: Uma2 family endonuclease [Planctomycetaceae bacterium]|nr:Uma2 family endonuclease [Planctomycetaceae bacterium]
MSTEIKPITAQEFMEMHFDVPVELVRGEIVFLYGVGEMTRPGWRHGIVCQNVGGQLWAWARSCRAGLVASNDTGFLTERNPDTVRGPDLFFISASRRPVGEIPAGISDAIPELCVEVWSPGDRWREVHRKIDEYLNRGVSEVWVVIPERKTVEVFRQEEAPVIFATDDVLRSDLLPGFECRVASLFEGLDEQVG